MKIDWDEVFQNLLPFLLLAIFSGVAKIIYNYRNSISIWYRRQKLKLFPADFNIAFSLDFKEGLNSGNYFNQIKKNFIKLLDNTGLQGEIKISDFSDIKQFKNKEEAEKFRNKKDIDLIIWGGFSDDSLKKEGEPISQIYLNFTYGHPDDQERRIGFMLLLDISSKLAIKKYWEIVDSESSRDVEIVSNNLFDISTYILALTLKISGRIEKSLNLFERLYNALLARQDNFSGHVIPHLLNCYSLIIIEKGVNRKNYELGKSICRKSLHFDKTNIFALANLAIFQYKSGEKEEAEKTVELLQQYHPRDPLTEVDVAFFRILQKKYSNALKHYKNLINFGKLNFNHQDVIEFLFEEYKQQKEPALLFGSGIISMVYGDKKLGKKDLEQFLRKANEEKYKPLRRMANRYLGRLE